MNDVVYGATTRLCYITSSLDKVPQTNSFLGIFVKRNKKDGVSLSKIYYVAITMITTGYKKYQ